MGNLVNSSKHISLVRSSIPKSDASNPVAEGRAWCCVEMKGGDVLFHVEKKKGGSPSRFKNGAAIAKYLVKMGVLDNKYKAGGKSHKAFADGKVVAGLVWRSGGELQMTCELKAKGGGKSTLKSALKVTKKLGLDASSVSIVKTAADQQEEQQEEAGASQESWARIKDVPNLEKWLKLHGKIAKELDKIRRLTEVTKEDVSLFEDFKRHVEKYDSKTTKTFLKTYKTKTDANGDVYDQLQAIIGGNPFEVDYLKDQLDYQSRRFEAAIQESDAEAEAAAEAAGDEQNDDEETKIALEVAEYAERLGMSESKLQGFAEAAEINLSATRGLFTEFAVKDIQQLFKYVGDGDWNRLFIQLDKMNR